MNKSKIFIWAHKITKKVIRTGDNYQATLGVCLMMLFSGEIVAKDYECDNLQLQLF